MSSKASAIPRTASSDTKEQIKAAAQTLFAKHGVEGVTVQQIVTAAGQRNNAALHYHFGSKEELVRQLVVDGATVLEGRRQQMLAQIGLTGGPLTIRQILLVLVMPVVELADDDRWRGYVRFTSNLQLSDGETLRAALNHRWNAGYIECLKLLKKKLALPDALADQRLTLMAIFANAVLSAREEALAKPRSKKSRLWDQKYTIENILDTLEATLSCEPSSGTMNLF